MDYSKFYTPPPIAALLVKILDISQPEIVIDICCGGCNLLHAAGERWKNAKLVGVDIVEHASSNINFTQIDGREFAIQHPAAYPLVLANPPFDYVAQKREFPSLYNSVFAKYRTSRLENEMLMANLLLVAQNGTLLIILPSTFVEAARNEDIRKLVGQNYHVKNIIKLPEDTFGSSNINSYALVIKHRISKHHLTKYCAVVRENGKYHFVGKRVIPQHSIRNGEWCVKPLHTTMLKLNIRRGNISSQIFSDSGIPVLHTAKRSTNWEPSVRYIKNYIESPVYAEPGDIIVSRIGKSAGQWCQYSGKRTPISDCLYCIKDPGGLICGKLKGKEYNLLLKGVATRYITIDDFVLWYSSVSEMQKCHRNDKETNFTS